MSEYYDLASFDKALEKYPEIKNGIVVDSCLLYGASFSDDKYYRSSDILFDKLAEYEIPVYSNVVTRAEFLDLVARKTLTRSAVEYFESSHKDRLERSFLIF